MNFKVGEKVVALTNPENGRCQSRKAGNVYTVMAVSYCVGCGSQRINIGVVDSAPFVRCYCGSRQPTQGFAWTGSRYFTRPISNEYKLEVAIPELITIKETQLQ